MKKILAFINRIMVYGFLLAFIFLLIYGTGKVSPPLSAIESFIVSLFLGWFFKIRKINDNNWFLVNIALWLNLIGDAYLFWAGPPFLR